MPRFLNNPPSAASGVDTDLPEYWLDGVYSSKIIKRHIAVLALGFASGASLLVGVYAFAKGVPSLGAVLFTGTICGLNYARCLIGTLKTWQWLDRKRSHGFELELVQLQGDHTTLKYQHGLLAGMVRRGEAEGAAGDGAPSAEVVDLNGRRTH